MAAIVLKSIAETARFGALLASELGRHKQPPLLLQGALGCGKTTLTANLVAAMPGGAEAEVSSPSFTICNLYPTHPPVLHCDLYRCKENMPDEILDFMDRREGQLIVEWAEFLNFTLPEFLDISFFIDKNARRLEISGKGANALAIIANLRQAETRP